MFRFTLVPSGFFEEDSASGYLASVVQLNEDFPVKYMELPQYKAVLVYYGDEGRASLLAREVAALAWISYYNKVLVYAPGDGTVDVMIAIGKELKIVNSFRADDSVTALYYVVSSMEHFGLKPRLVVLNVFGEDGLDMAGEASGLFKGVESVS